MKTTTVLKQAILLWVLCFSMDSIAQDVYIAGYDTEASSSRIAQIWEADGTEHSLTNGNELAYAHDVFVHNDDVYVAGSESNGTTLVATLWKNGIPQLLTDGSYYAEANSVFVSGSDVYAVGLEANATNIVAKIWKNGIPQTLTDNLKSGEANSVFVSGNDVYVAGYENNNGRTVATLWKNGTPQNLTDGSKYASANSVFVSGSDVYVAGYESNGTHSVAKLWKNGVPQILTNGAEDAFTNSVFVNNDDVYVAGYVYDGDDPKPKIWKNGVEEALNINSAFDGAKANSVYVSGNDVYVAGISTASNGNDECEFATFWKNGAAILIDPACPDYNEMNSVFVDDGQLGVENIAGPQNKITLHPNPVKDILHVAAQSGNIQKIDLFSITGQRLKSWEGQDEINIAQVATGSYFVKITTQNGETAVKQVIKK